MFANNKTLVMGVLNTTPDSFSDGGEFLQKNAIQKRIDIMLQEKVDIIDIGGESSAPDSQKVSEEEEWKRILPALKYCQKKRVFVSVDTYKSKIAQKAIGLGAKMINDVTALRGDTQMVKIIAKSGVKIVLMYSKDNSARTTKEVKKYTNVIEEIKDFLQERIDFAISKGVKKEQIVIDPGMGAFVSSKPEPSLEILKNLAEFKSLGCPILIGASRKSFIGQVLDLPIQERLEGSLTAVAIATYNGVDIIRVHNVLETKRVVKMSEAIRRS